MPLTSSILIAVMTALLGYLLGILKSDREYRIGKSREVTATLYEKAWEFLDNKSPLIQGKHLKTPPPQTLKSEINERAERLINGFYGEALYYDDKLYEEIDVAMRACKKYVRDSLKETSTGPSVAHSDFWKWYEKHFFPWLRNSLRLIHRPGTAISKVLCNSNRDLISLKGGKPFPTPPSQFVP